MINLKWTVSGKFNPICLFSHNWLKVKASSTTVYWKCGRCRRREILQHAEEYQPIDKAFINEDL